MEAAQQVLNEASLPLGRCDLAPVADDLDNDDVLPERIEEWLEVDLHSDEFLDGRKIQDIGKR
jgi:hypothetical protein